MTYKLASLSGNDLKTKLPQYSAKTMSSSLWTTEANGYLTFCVSVAFLYSVIFCFFNCDFRQKEAGVFRKRLLLSGEMLTSFSKRQGALVSCSFFIPVLK